MGSQLHPALYSLLRLRGDRAIPYHCLADHTGDLELLGGTDEHRPGGRADRQHIARLAIGGRAVQVQPPTLADREPVRAAMPAEHRPGSDNPRAAASARTWSFTVSPSGNIAPANCVRVSTAST